jgi:hypothetical protein
VRIVFVCLKEKGETGSETGSETGNEKGSEMLLRYKMAQEE